MLVSVVMKLSGELDGDIAEAFGLSLAIAHSLLLSIHLCQNWTGHAGRFDEQKCGIETWDLFQILHLMQQTKSLILYLVK